MSQAILYSFRRCPYAMRARMALFVAGLNYEHREVILRDKPASMLTVSPKGTVPVFVAEDGTVIDESLAVMEFALGKNDPDSWLRDTTQTTDAFIDVIDGDFKFHLDRYKYASRYDDTAKRGDVNLEHRREAMACLQKWEEALKTHTYLIDDDISLADIATFPFIRQFAATEPDWWGSNPLPNIAQWLEGLVNSDLFQAIMKKYPLWKDPT